MSGIVMFDTIENGQFPPGGDAYAGYVDGGVGDQPNYAFVVSAFPDAHHLSIALFARDDADCLDVEPGAAQPSDIHGWHARQVARGITRPVIYASASTMEAEVLPVVAGLPGGRDAARLWTAHYGLGEHICGPATCNALSTDADGTQWTSSALGRVLDQSLLLPGFFGPQPASDPTEAIVRQLPVLKLGDSGPDVRRVQGLLVAAGHDLGTTGLRKDGIDGTFGRATDAAVRSLQAACHIGVDGVVGPGQTWPALLGVA